MALKPWHKVVNLREDLRSGQSLTTDIFAVHLDHVRLGTAPKDYLNPDSLTTLASCRVEPSLAGASAGNRYQFERLGYFCADTKDSCDGFLVFNRIVTLRDQWARIKKAEEK